MTDSASTILLVPRLGFASLLLDEVRGRARSTATARVVGDGLVEVVGRCDPNALIFARLAFRKAAFLPEERLNPLADEDVVLVLGEPAGAGEPYALASLPVGDDPDRRLQRRTGGVARALTRRAGKLLGWSASDPGQTGHLWVLCLTADGLYAGPAVGGRERDAVSGACDPYRARMDRRAPSRSYLKIEEAFMRMGCQPAAGEWVVDLGAAPGGWTFAFVKRGCTVTAVDRGPLRLPKAEPGWGSARHVRGNGITFDPGKKDASLDWLVADMLVAPGVVMGLLRRWMGRRLARRIVCNVKLPQKRPFVEIQKLEEFLRGQKTYRAQIVHLYHDRREVTVLAERAGSVRDME